MDRTQALVDWLRARVDCELEEGLDEPELARAEETTSVTFPPLWRAVLARVHPLATGRVAYPDWRLRDDSAARLVARPDTGVLFDVEHNDFWWPAWGARPPDTALALDLAREHLASVPRLVPIRGHWYTGSADGDPVFSIVQTDVHLRADDLTSLATTRTPDARVRVDPVPFWTDLYAWSAGLG